MHLSLRGMGPWPVSLYLKELGGREDGPAVVRGEGWHAEVTSSKPVEIGSIRLGVTEVAIEGDPAIVDQIARALEKKAMRAGG